MATIEKQEPGLALAVQNGESRELAPIFAQATAKHEIEAAVVLAKRFPRNEDDAFGKLMESCHRFNFAIGARYKFPRGGKSIEGPSAPFTREVARCWGNIRYGLDITQDSEDMRSVRGWAWDMETNVRVSQDATFKKLIYRKKGGWVKPDERDLRELTNRQGAITVRNCLLQILPPHLASDAVRECVKTVEANVAKDPDDARHKMVMAFGSIGVSVGELEEYLGHPLRQATAKEIADLRGIWKSISDGNSTWHEYVQADDDAATKRLSEQLATAAKKKEEADAKEQQPSPSRPADPA